MRVTAPGSWSRHAGIDLWPVRRGPSTWALNAPLIRSRPTTGALTYASAADVQTAPRCVS